MNVLPRHTRPPETDRPTSRFEIGSRLSEYLDIGLSVETHENQQYIINHPSAGVFAVVGGMDEKKHEKPAANVVGEKIDNCLTHLFDANNPEESMRQAFDAAEREKVDRVASHDISQESFATVTALKFFHEGGNLKAVYGHIGQAGILLRKGRGRGAKLDLITSRHSANTQPVDGDLKQSEFGVLDLQPDDRVAIISKAIMGIEPHEQLKRDQIEKAMSISKPSKAAKAFTAFSKRVRDKAAVVIDVVKKPTRTPMTKLSGMALGGAAAATTAIGSKRMAWAEKQPRDRNRAKALGIVALGGLLITAAVIYANTRGHDIRHPASNPLPDKPTDTLTQLPPDPTPSPTPAPVSPPSPAKWHPHNFYVEPGSGIENEIHQQGHRLVGHDSFTGADAHRVAAAAHRKFGDHVITLLHHPGPDEYKVAGDVRLSAPGAAHYSSHAVEAFIHNEILKAAA